MVCSIVGPDVSQSWLEAVNHLLSVGGECRNLAVSIECPLQSKPQIDTAYQNLLADHGLRSLKQVTYTVFPRSLYIRVRRDANQLFDRYNRPNGIYERLRRRHSRRFGWGSYFRRMTHFPSVDRNGHMAFVNQLGDIVAMLRNRRRLHRAAYTVQIQIPGQDGKRTRGGPCLNYIALQLRRPRVVDLLAVYRSHDFVQRAYGNYLSLGYLMEFLQDQTDYSVGCLTCLSSFASIRDLSGQASWPSTRELRALTEEMREQ